MDNNNIVSEDANEQVDQVVLAQSVSDNIKYEMVKDVLVKPLEPIKVVREFKVPVVESTEEQATNEEGEALEYKKVETKTEEVESVYRKGIILKLPVSYTEDVYKIGQTVVYNGRFAAEFDLLKDSQLVKLYDIIAIAN